MGAMQLHWDIFCRVIDNFGDIGVCWRLARQLVAEHGRKVRLWVDDLSSLSPLEPAVSSALDTQYCQGVEIRRWVMDISFGSVAEVVIEAFACELPPAYVQAMAVARIRPCWINLEYLTAEPWAEGCHGMASPHPTLPLTKYFFFPGFTERSGGLLRESRLPLPQRGPALKPPAGGIREISLFCYETAPVDDLLDAVAESRWLCHVPEGKPLNAVRACLGGSGPWHHGNSMISPIPFMPVDDYDDLLWRCDVNFVRGEDSFVRAQWAAKPFVWQIYPQDDDAHRVKLEAFLERYCEDMDGDLELTVREMFEAWNSGEGVAKAWKKFAANLARIASHNRRWADRLARQPDMASQLVNFCANRV